jgi:hypothetical protein
MRASWVGVVLAAAGVVLAACGDEADTQASSTTVEGAESTTTTATQSTEGTAAADPGTFESEHYSYALRVPSDVDATRWQQADQTWDGARKIEMAGPFVDIAFFPERSVFLYGTTEPGDLETFFTTVAGDATQHHQCSEPQNRRDVMIGEVPAVAFTQACEADSMLARVVLVRDNYGLVAFSSTVAGEEAVAIDEIVARLDALEWRLS